MSEPQAVAPRATVVRLSAMFWLAQMSDAASLVLLSGYMADLGFSGTQISSVYATMAMAALVSPFLAGWLADRFFPSQVMLGICYILAAPILVGAWQQTTFEGFWFCIAGVSLLRMPARTLSNVVAFYHLGDRTRIGQVRVWGTLGWIFVSWCLSGYLRLWEGWDPGGSHMGDALLASAVVSAICGLYCLGLPHTPPGNRQASSLGLGASFRLLRNPGFVVLLGIGFVSSTMNPFFYNFAFLFLTEAQGVGLAPSTANWVQSLGQVGEVAVLLMLGTTLRRFGIKRILLVGIAAQSLRFSLFTLGDPAWLVAAAMCLHGFVFTFYAVGITIAVDEMSDADNRASAQGLMAMIRGGAGSLLGNYLAGTTYDRLAVDGGGHEWTSFFLLPAVVTGVGLIIFGLLFRHGRNSKSTR
ncbi:MAG: MFS transporter [Candidatus Latescibacterota bacterium]|nr:MFS transporter [Candidatus Latescibacterota bacterium]